jgi:hypothetical protein
MTKIKGTSTFSSPQPKQQQNDPSSQSPISSPRTTLGLFLYIQKTKQKKKTGRYNFYSKLFLDEDEKTVSFPAEELQRLDEMINKTRWIVPVLAKQELEILLDSAITLCKEGLDVKNDNCQRFFRDGLIISFTKILTDEAVKTWKLEIHVI